MDCPVDNTELSLILNRSTIDLLSTSISSEKPRTKMPCSSLCVLSYPNLALGNYHVSYSAKADSCSRYGKSFNQAMDEVIVSGKPFDLKLV